MGLISTYAVECGAYIEVSYNGADIHKIEVPRHELSDRQRAQRQLGEFVWAEEEAEEEEEEEEEEGEA